MLHKVQRESRAFRGGMWCTTMMQTLKTAQTERQFYKKESNGGLVWKTAQADTRRTTKPVLGYSLIKTQGTLAGTRIKHAPPYCFLSQQILRKLMKHWVLYKCEQVRQNLLVNDLEKKTIVMFSCKNNLQFLAPLMGFTLTGHSNQHRSFSTIYIQFMDSLYAPFSYRSTNIQRPMRMYMGCSESFRTIKIAHHYVDLAGRGKWYSLVMSLANWVAKTALPYLA